jgi:prophage antirepressor-like protein
MINEKKFNTMQAFLNHHNKAIKTIQLDGETWWALKDACNVWGFSNKDMQMFLHQFDDDDIRPGWILNCRGEQKCVKVITKEALYSIILLSARAEVKTFRHWLTKNVATAKMLPSTNDKENQ